jgi:hypothetical protein
VICLARKEEYFFGSHWTGQIGLNCFDKSGFARMGVTVMAGLVPATQVSFLKRCKDVDARDNPGLTISSQNGLSELM